MFKDYFFKVLNWLPIFNHSGLACIVEGLARYFDAVRLDIILARNQFIVELADVSLLSAFGESRGILRSRYDNDDEYRRRVVYAYKWQLLGGKVKGLETILADYGFKGGEIVNIRFEDAVRWAEFDYVYPDNTLFEDKYDNMTSLLNQYKPARSKLHGIIFPYKLSGTIYIGGKARIYQAIKSYMKH